MVDSDPDAVSVDYTTEPATAEAGRDYTPASGTFTFVKGGPQEQSFSLETFDDGKFTGNLRCRAATLEPCRCRARIHPAGVGADHRPRSVRSAAARRLRGLPLPVG